MKTILTLMPNYKNSMRGRFTLEIGFPWLAFGAIIELERILLLNPNFNILEFGSGGSTVFFSRRCRSVTSYETDIEWGAKVKEFTDPLINVTLIRKDFHDILHDIDNMPKVEFYDIILVDSGPFYHHRKKILDRVPPFLRKGGYLIVDNYSQRHLLGFDYSGYDVYAFDSLVYHGSGTKICIKK